MTIEDDIWNEHFEDIQEDYLEHGGDPWYDADDVQRIKRAVHQAVDRSKQSTAKEIVEMLEESRRMAIADTDYQVACDGIIDKINKRYITPSNTEVKP